MWKFAFCQAPFLLLLRTNLGNAVIFFSKTHVIQPILPWNRIIICLLKCSNSKNGRRNRKTTNAWSRDNYPPFIKYSSIIILIVLCGTRAHISHSARFRHSSSTNSVVARFPQLYCCSMSVHDSQMLSHVNRSEVCTSCSLIVRF